MDRDLRERTKRFALRIIKLYVALPSRGVGKVLGLQVLKAGTSVGAHYREAQRAKSNADFISKIEGALQELDETGYWLELLAEGNVLPAKRLTALRQEVEELVSILVTIVKKVKAKGRLRTKQKLPAAE
jgi:four helix bundle protein